MRESGRERVEAGEFEGAKEKIFKKSMERFR